MVMLLCAVHLPSLHAPELKHITAHCSMGLINPQESMHTDNCDAAYMQVGVFVSLVSTKIPFKGAGKEYIGDDVEEMVGAVKHAIQQCGVQLKVRERVQKAENRCWQ